MIKIGCHVSIAGGIQNAPFNAANLGCEVFQMFTRSPRGGDAPKLTKEILEKFQTELVKYKFPEFVIHTPYFINFGSQNPRIFFGSVAVVRQELERATILKSPYVITHLGSYKNLGRKRGFEQLISGLSKVMQDYRGSAKLLLENSAGAGELMGGTFEELRDILHHPRLKNFQLGVCLDTCHLFASGYDLRDKQAVKKTFAQFDHTAGGKALKVIHVNDSAVDLGARKDRHEHIGKGKIGLLGFKAIMQHPRFKKINVYLETEHPGVKKDIEVLKGLRKR